MHYSNNNNPSNIHAIWRYKTCVGQNNIFYSNPNMYTITKLFSTGNERNVHREDKIRRSWYRRNQLNPIDVAPLLQMADWEFPHITIRKFDEVEESTSEKNVHVNNNRWPCRPSWIFKWFDRNRSPSTAPNATRLKRKYDVFVYLFQTGNNKDAFAKLPIRRTGSILQYFVQLAVFLQISVNEIRNSVILTEVFIFHF